MLSVGHGMIEILTPVGTFLRSGLTVWEQESPHFREGRKSKKVIKPFWNRPFGQKEKINDETVVQQPTVDKQTNDDE